MLVAHQSAIVLPARGRPADEMSGAVFRATNSQTIY